MITAPDLICKWFNQIAEMGLAIRESDGLGMTINELIILQATIRF